MLSPPPCIYETTIQEHPPICTTCKVCDKPIGLVPVSRAQLLAQPACIILYQPTPTTTGTSVKKRPMCNLPIPSSIESTPCTVLGIADSAGLCLLACTMPVACVALCSRRDSLDAKSMQPCLSLYLHSLPLLPQPGASMHLHVTYQAPAHPTRFLVYLPILRLASSALHFSRCTPVKLNYAPCCIEISALPSNMPINLVSACLRF